MTTPHEIKFRLEQRLLALAGDGGPVPVITGVHSITVEGNTVFVGYDLLPPPPTGHAQSATPRNPHNAPLPMVSCSAS
jgi:hypothetical protein